MVHGLTYLPKQNDQIPPIPCPPVPPAPGHCDDVSLDGRGSLGVRGLLNRLYKVMKVRSITFCDSLLFNFFFINGSFAASFQQLGLLIVVDG
jgi:hypothetical protein